MTIVGGFVFCWWDLADLSVESSVVEPVDVFESGVFDVVGGARVRPGVKA